MGQPSPRRAVVAVIGRRRRGRRRGKSPGAYQPLEQIALLETIAIVHAAVVQQALQFRHGEGAVVPAVVVRAGATPPSWTRRPPTRRGGRRPPPDEGSRPKKPMLTGKNTDQ